MTVEDYMAACNEHYYATRDPLGAAGDFTTAPEISQMFGELVGAVLADAWRRAGSPTDGHFVELGPGRGTLAADALRAMRSAGLDPPVHLVETSPMLRQAQVRAVPRAAHYDRIDYLPSDGPLLVVANEFLDALPIRQHIDGAERHIVAIGDALTFDADGEVVETSPARDAVMRLLAERLVAQGGTALLIDYGHVSTAPGDTLQAVSKHQFASILDRPGEQDLTSHVDFERVAQVAQAAGALASKVADQGSWLQQLGIEARAQMLKQGAPQRADEIDHALVRLCHPNQMGRLFKVIAMGHPDWPVPAGL